MLVSVIIPYFNDIVNTERANKSAFNQNYKKLEIIIIDDENSISSKKILANLRNKFKRVKVFSTHIHSGVSRARNLGVKKAKGDFIAFLDSDDLWKKTKIKEQLSFINNNNVDICYTDYLAINESNKIVYKVRTPKVLFYKDLLRECPIACSSVLVKKEILKNNPFKNLNTKEDYMLWLDLSKKGFNLLGLNKFLSIYRVRSNTLSSRHFNKLYSAFKIYSRHLDYNFLFSIIFVIRLYINAFKKKYL
jgi:teichuronic acid biosynthesis glycosyltransferase TuaG